MKNQEHGNKKMNNVLRIEKNVVVFVVVGFFKSLL
jgi:hypothetical protein